MCRVPQMLGPPVFRAVTLLKTQEIIGRRLLLSNLELLAFMTTINCPGLPLGRKAISIIAYQLVARFFPIATSNFSTYIQQLLR